MLRLENMQNNDENEILSTSSCRKIRYVIIDDYKAVDDEHANVNNQLFI